MHRLNKMNRPPGEPEWLRTSGWQPADDEHPAGSGRPAYRLVFKTLRYVIPFASFQWPNLRINTGQGSVDRGGMVLPGALPTRQRGRWLLPESGSLTEDDGFVRYGPHINMKFEFRAWQESIDDVFYIEFLLETTAATPEERLVEGARRLAPLLTQFDLRFGPRVLGLKLTEELGELFDDGHFNRELVSQQVGTESQYDVVGVEGDEFLAWAQHDFDRLMQKTPERLDRIRLACDWYWTAIHTPSAVDEFLGLWFVVEVLAMPDTANVRPVRELLARDVGGSPDSWRDFVGRLSGRRDALVHGNEPRAVGDEELTRLRALVEVLLQLELSELDERRRSRLLAYRSEADTE